MHNRILLLVFAGIIYSSCAVSQSFAADYILFATSKNDIFRNFIQGCSESLSGNIHVNYIRSMDNSELEKELSKTRNNEFSGIIVTGKAAFDAIGASLPTNVPMVLCAYSEFSEKEMSVKDKTPCKIYSIMTPLTKYDSLISDVFPEYSKVAVIHKTDFSLPVTENIQTKVYRINSWKQLKSTVTNAIRWCDIVWIPADPAFTSTALAFIIKECLRSKTPLLTSSPRIIKGGAIGGLVRSPSEMGKAAVRWLKSCAMSGTTAPSNIDSIKPTLVSNPKVARFLKIPLPSTYQGKSTVSITNYKQ